MKKQLLFFLLGGFAFLCIGAGVATSTNILTVKPATPKSTIVKLFNSEGDGKNVSEFITLKVKEGWIVKSVSSGVWSQYRQTWIVVMEKY